MNVKVLESQATIGKAAMGAIAFFGPIGSGVDPTTFDAVIDHLGLAWNNPLLVLVIRVNPQPKEQQEACPHVEQEEEIYFERYH